MPIDKDVAFRDRARHYAEILNPLFDSSRFMRNDRLFEFVCALVRPAGIHDADWDAWHESQQTLDDLGNLTTMELPQTLFPDPDRTRVRLSLLSYCHLTEMDLPYALTANLLRLRLGRKYDIEPFRDLYRPIREKGRSVQKMKPPTPRQKLAKIRELARAAELEDVGSAFESIYDRVIRNAIYHSDYTLAKGELRLLRDFHSSPTKGYSSPVVEWSELAELFTNTFAFYTALFALYERCRKAFGDFVNAFIPYDGHYKGILELVFDNEGRLSGFRTYWPNGTLAEYQRKESTSMGTNLQFDPDGSINFFVGLYADKPGKFSPLVEVDGAPTYPKIPGRDESPHWPHDHKVYKLPPL